MTEQEYHLIEYFDLENPQEFASPELVALGKLWQEKKKELENSDEFNGFIKKLQREWAIETGIIERLYTWDRGVTETLIEQGIDASTISYRSGMNRDEADNVARMINDQQYVVEALFEFVKGEKPLNEHFIRGMHQKLTANQHYTEALNPENKIVQIPLLKGKYKEQPNNPKRPNGTIHHYCPPLMVEDEMEFLIQRYQEYESENVSSEVLSAWLHHCFTHIHPFQDGNGRIARSIASLVFLRRGLFPLLIRESDRDEYISALEEADNGELGRLVKLFAKSQRDSILAALGIQQQVKQSKHSEQIIDNAIAILKSKSKDERERLSNVQDVATKIHEHIEKQINEIAINLDKKLQNIDNLSSDQYKATHKSVKDGAPDSYYFKRQIVEIAQKYKYFANTDYYKSWVRLTIHSSSIYEIIFSIHGYGHQDNGVMVVSCFTFEKIPSENGAEETATKSPIPDIFQFNYLEKEEDTLDRFKDWLEDAISLALASWQKSIR